MADTPAPNSQLSAPVEGVAPQAAVPSAPVPQAPDPKLEAIIRREKQLYRRDRELKAREEALKTRESQWKPDEYIPKKKFESDPLATLQELGYDYNKLTERQLQEPNSNDPTIRAMLSKINSLEERLSANANSQQQAQEQQYEQVKSQMLADAQSYTQGNPDFELVDKWGAHDLIVSEIEREFERTQKEMGRGIVISMETAAKRVEDNLYAEAIKTLEFNKIKNYKKPVTPDSATSPSQQTQQVTQQRPAKGQIPYKVSTVRTLTNTMTQDKPSSSKSSMEDRIRRARAAYNGEKVE